MTSKYILVLKKEDDGTIKCRSLLRGCFSSLELLGLLEWKAGDIRKQMAGEIKPDIVSRKILKDAKGGGNG